MSNWECVTHGREYVEGCGGCETGIVLQNDATAGPPTVSDARQKALDELRAIGARVKAKRDADPDSPIAAQLFQLAALIGKLEAEIEAGRSRV